MIGLDQRADQAADADAVAAHLHRHAAAIGGDDRRPHRFGILGAEEEDLPDLDPAPDLAATLGDRIEHGRVMGFIRAGIGRRELRTDRGDFLAVVVIDRAVAQLQLRHRAVIKDLAFAGRGKDEEFMRVVAANGTAIRAHRDRRQAHAFVGPQVADHVAVIGMQRVLARQVEVVAVLHQELAPAHDTETGADLIAELPLDVVKRQRQVLVAVHMGPEDVGDHLLIRRAVKHVAFMPVADAQHFLPVIVIAAALTPEVGGLKRRHQKRDMARALLLLMHDLFDPAQHLEAHRQPGIDPGGLLLYHARAQHVAMADDLGLGGIFLEDGEEVAGQTHRGLSG